jgi:hypothetical protein
MIINPSEKRDYNELLEKAIESVNKRIISETISLNELKKINLEYEFKRNDVEGILIIFDCIIKLLIGQYNQIINSSSSNINNGILHFFKILIYDFIDIRKAIEHFIGLQLFTIERSIIEHTRIYITCLLDDNFKSMYFEGYNTEVEKKNRFYSKRGNKIDKRLNDFYQEAKMEFEKSGKENTSTYLLAINSDNLYKKIFDLFSEMSHLSEFVSAEKVINGGNKILFEKDKTSNYDKYFDLFIEYAIGTCTIIYKIHNEKLGLKSDANSINLYNVLVSIHQELQKYRTYDTVLVGLKEKIKDIFDE